MRYVELDGARSVPDDHSRESSINGAPASVVKNRARQSHGMATPDPFLGVPGPPLGLERRRICWYSGSGGVMVVSPEVNVADGVVDTIRRKAVESCFLDTVQRVVPLAVAPIAVTDRTSGVAVKAPPEAVPTMTLNGRAADENAAAVVAGTR